MKHTSCVSLMFCVAAICLFALCGKKKSTEQQAVAVIGTDTIKASELEKFCPDTGLNESEYIRCNVVLRSLSSQAVPPADTADFRKAVGEISEQASMRSGAKWPSDQTASVLNAARALQKKLDAAVDAESVARYIDSIFASVSVIGSQDSAQQRASSAALGIGLDGAPMNKRMALAVLLSRTFGLAPEIADIFADYASIESAGPKAETKVSDIVKGLVYDPAKQQLDKARMSEIQHRETDNSALALRYRPRASIMDSISRHLVYLEALYKKKLKIHNDMAGTVAVSFRVSASGDVLTAQIARSEIYEKDFLEPFLEYAKTMRFAPIPDNVGSMTFEFPFEFKAR